MTPGETERTPTHHGALVAAARWRLPFSRQAWRGTSGNWLGVGAGSSLDFQDHRNYVPGDDPRHIHWAAFARTGSLTMKLYRAEAAPLVEIVVDVSGSMSLTPHKSIRVDELLAFCVECADRAGAPARVRAACGRETHSISSDQVRAGRWRDRIPPTPGKTQPPGPLPWRSGSMKILISDLLFPSDPSNIITPLAAAAGTAILFVPALVEESILADRGNIELSDCESDAKRHQRVDSLLATRYQEAYVRHFNLWREAARRRGVLFARIPCEGKFASVLAGEASSSGAVEMAN